MIRCLTTCFGLLTSCIIIILLLYYIILYYYYYIALYKNYTGPPPQYNFCMVLHMCFDFLNVDSNLRTVLLYYGSRGMLVFDCRMTMMTEVRRGRKIKMTPVSLVRRAA